MELEINGVIITTKKLADEVSRESVFHRLWYIAHNLTPGSNSNIDDVISESIASSFKKRLGIRYQTEIEDCLTEKEKNMVVI